MTGGLGHVGLTTVRHSHHTLFLHHTVPGGIPTFLAGAQRLGRVNPRPGSWGSGGQSRLGVQGHTGREGPARQTLPPPSLRCPTAGPSSRSRRGVVTTRGAGCPPGSLWAGAAGGTLLPPCPPRSRAGGWRQLWPGPRAGGQRAHLHTCGSRLTQGLLPAWRLGPTDKQAPQEQDYMECSLVGWTLLSVSGAHSHPLGEVTRQ